MSWNKPSSAPQPPPKKSAPPSLKRGLLAGLVVVALGALGLYLFSGGEATSSSLQKKDRGLIKEVTPAAAPKAVEEAPVPEKPKKKFWEVPASQTNGFTEAMRLKWVHEHMPKPGHTNDSSRFEAPPEYAIFDHHVENTIAAYLTMEPGEQIVGEPMFGRKFVKGFLEALKMPIIVKETDTPEQKELKRLMVDTMADLKARYDAGEDIAQIMNDTHKEALRLSQYRSELELEYKNFKRKKDVSLADVEDFIQAANILLDQKGIAPLKGMSPVTKRMLMRREQTDKGLNNK